MIQHNDPQNSERWYAARRGVITASKAKDARNRTNGLDKKQQLYVDAMLRGQDEAAALLASGYKSRPTSDLVKRAVARETLPLVWGESAISYAQDLARERLGGGLPGNDREGFAQRTGHEEEPFAAIAYVAKTGVTLDEVGFMTTDDRRFGVSYDRRIAGVRAAIECKTMVSSSTLFRCIVDGDVSEFRDQLLFELWIDALEWIDLCLWVPDLSVLHVIRIERDEDKIQALEDDLVAFNALVDEHVAKLSAKLGISPIDGAPADTADDLQVQASTPAVASRRAPTPPLPASTPTAITSLEF